MRHYRRHVAEDQGREEVFWEDLYGGIWQVYKFAPWHTKLCSKWWWQCLKLCHPTVEDWMLVYGIRWRYQRGWQAKSATLLAVLHSHFQGFHFINNACKSVNFSISIFLHYPLGCLISSSGEDSSMCMVYLAEMSHYICICKVPWGISGSNETQVASVSRIGRSIGVLYPLLGNFDCEQSVQKSSSK